MTASEEWPAYRCCGRKSLHSRGCVNAVQERYWNGTRSGLDALCKWANGFYPLDDPVLTYNFTDNGWWDAPVLETENGPLELRNGDYVVFMDGEFNIRTGVRGVSCVRATLHRWNYSDTAFLVFALVVSIISGLAIGLTTVYCA